MLKKVHFIGQVLSQGRNPVYGHIPNKAGEQVKGSVNTETVRNNEKYLSTTRSNLVSVQEGTWKCFVDGEWESCAATSHLGGVHSRYHPAPRKGGDEVASAIQLHCSLLIIWSDCPKRIG